jgi:hypothetical protein
MIRAQYPLRRMAAVVNERIVPRKRSNLWLMCHSGHHAGSILQPATCPLQAGSSKSPAARSKG